jgi:hypothetical protein
MADDLTCCTCEVGINRLREVDYGVTCLEMSSYFDIEVLSENETRCILVQETLRRRQKSKGGRGSQRSHSCSGLRRKAPKAVFLKTCLYSVLFCSH